MNKDKSLLWLWWAGENGEKNISVCENFYPQAHPHLGLGPEFMLRMWRKIPEAENWPTVGHGT